MDVRKARAYDQFQKTADAYVTSRVHAVGSDLEWLPGLVPLTGQEQVLDVATGGGHTAFAIAPHVADVVGLDLTPAMVAKAAEGAAHRTLANARFVVGDVENLPFPDAAFDLVTCRIAAHHFPALNHAMAEMARVLKPGGHLIIVDNYAPASEELDQFINWFEWRRDPSHVRAYTLTEWEAAYRQAGLSFDLARTFTSSHEFDGWVATAQTPAETVAELRAALTGAPPAVKNGFGVQTEPVLQFTLHKAVMVGARP